MNQADLDNHANQLNPDHEEYWHCREQPELPNNYQSDSEDDDKQVVQDTSSGFKN
jgi:hypothetical protein